MTTFLIQCYDDDKYQNSPASKSFFNWFELIRQACLDDFIEKSVVCIPRECLEEFGGEDWNKPTMIKMMKQLRAILNSVKMGSSIRLSYGQVYTADLNTSLLLMTTAATKISLTTRTSQQACTTVTGYTILKRRRPRRGQLTKTIQWFFMGGNKPSLYGIQKQQSSYKVLRF